jgi:hypothetical protein
VAELDRRRLLHSVFGAGVVAFVPGPAEAVNRRSKKQAPPRIVEIITRVTVNETATVKTLDPAKDYIEGSVTKVFTGTLRTLEADRGRDGEWPYEPLKSTSKRIARSITGSASTSGTYLLRSAPNSNPDVTQSVRWGNRTDKIEISHFTPEPSVFGSGFDAVGRFYAVTKPIDSTITSNGASVAVALSVLTPVPTALSSFGDPGSFTVFRSPPEARPDASALTPLAQPIFDAIQLMKSGSLVVFPVLSGVQILGGGKSYPVLTFDGSYVGRGTEPNLDMVQTVSVSISTSVARTSKQSL